MTDLARLGIGIDATKVVEADKALDGMAAAAREAATEVKKLETATKSAGAEAKASANSARAAEKEAAAATRAAAKEARDKAKAVKEAAKDEERAAKDAARESAKAAREQIAAAAAVNRERVRAEREASAAIVSTRRRTQAEMINLSRQVQDVGVSLFSGQNPLTVIAQQGAQIGDIIATSEGRVTASLGRMARSAGRFLVGPVGIAGMAVTAAGAIGFMAESFAARQRDIERSLIGVGRGSGQTAGSIDAMAVRSAAGSSMSQREMRSAIAAFASTGMSGSLLQGAAGQVRGYSLATGQSYEDSQKELASAFRDPTSGAAKLNERFGFLNQALEDYIRNAQQAGDKTRAQKALQDALAPSVAEAAKQVGIFTKAWEGITNAASSFYSTVERGAGRLVYGTTALEKYREAMAAVTSFESAYAGRTLSPRQRATLESRRARAEALRTPEAIAQQKKLDDDRLAIERNATSRSAGALVGRMFEDVGRRQSLTADRDLLIKALGDPETVRLMGDAGMRAKEALDALTTSLDNFETQAERSAKDSALAIQSTLAYTMAERAAVEMERARTEAIRAGRSELQATTEAEQARQRMLAESKRRADDLLRDANENAGMLGLSPAQQRIQAIRNRYAREQAQYGGDSGGPAQSRTIGGAPAIEYGTGLVPAETGLRITVQAGGRKSQKDIALDAIERFESGGRNIHQQAVPAGGGYNPSTGTVTGPSSAQGYFQITNTTWRSIAAQAGIDLRQYPNAMSAPYDVQRQAAGALYDRGGLSDWAPYNARLRAWVAQGSPANDNWRGGGATAGDATRGTAMGQDITTERRRAMEEWSAPINQANRSLEEQNRALEQRRSLMGASIAEQTRLAEAQRLTNEYMRDGTEITPALSTAIGDYARRAGEAAEADRKLAEEQKQVTELNGALADGVKGFISDLRSGKSAAEAFSNALGRIGDKLLDMAINSIFNAGGAQGGLLGSILGAFLPKPGAIMAQGGAYSYGVRAFARGGVVSGPTIFPFADGVGLMGEAGPEAIMPLSRDSSGRLGVTAPRAANSNRAATMHFGNTEIAIYGNADEKAMRQMSIELANHRRDLARMARELESAGHMQDYGVSLGQVA